MNPSIIEEAKKLDTLEKNLEAVLRNDPRYLDLLGPRKARDLFMLGAQAAMHVIATTSQPGDLASVMVAMMKMHRELGVWLGLVKPPK